MYVHDLRDVSLGKMNVHAWDFLVLRDVYPGKMNVDDLHLQICLNDES